MNEARSSGPMIDRDTAAELMEPLTDLVVRAGAAILAVDRLAMKIDGKADGSPVTEADLAADRIIGEGLARLIPEVPVLSEERVFSLRQEFDYDGLAGRLWSSSYAPLEGHPSYEPMMQELQRIFRAHAKDNVVEFEYDTRVFYGHL